ncbi:uncharacterized protein LOC115625405 [Scaptodrosophila lebanonensis]|uniref:Uncharacterized protein LOC115625405 n=1 Tax=Drosophila lebanonensis TaxID=7225 RepID=A0A6J2TJW7_DROLE|nr:uncharacterized protein LOC115625405 [Scaptodrosophila lebanonensis]
MLINIVVANDNSTNSNNNKDVSFLLKKPQNMVELLHRQKRWLVYDVGTSLLMTANCAKLILGGTPKGLVWLAELTLIYSLPAGPTDWLPRRKGKKPTIPPIPPLRKPPAPPPPAPPVVPPPAPPAVIPPPPVGVAPIIVPYNPSNPTQPFILASGRRHSHDNQDHSACPASDLYKDRYGTYYCRPSTEVEHHRRLRRQFEEEGTNVLNDHANPHAILFDLITLLSSVYSYKPRYCIMRTLCESRHLISPPGRNLFHDMFRILLRHVYPEIAHKPQYREAFTAGHSLHECSSLYGPHCKHSFLLELIERFQPEKSKKNTKL